mmetsp:Transcript_13162/g.30928  ORF Transcript_13162/g.30928 Transcript_13162/m.30928 type:complete len:265 (-) Transcript_13162:632-1426(-)
MLLMLPDLPARLGAHGHQNIPRQHRHQRIRPVALRQIVPELHTAALLRHPVSHTHLRRRAPKAWSAPARGRGARCCWLRGRFALEVRPARRAVVEGAMPCRTPPAPPNARRVQLREAVPAERAPAAVAESVEVFDVESSGAVRGVEGRERVAAHGEEERLHSHDRRHHLNRLVLGLHVGDVRPVCEAALREADRARGEVDGFERGGEERGAFDRGPEHPEMAEGRELLEGAWLEARDAVEHQEQPLEVCKVVERAEDHLCERTR